MNTIRRFLALTLLALLPSFATAADPAPAPAAVTYQYKGEITGVACAACSKHVKTALQKLPGVTTLKVVPSETTGIATLELTSTSPDITKESAILALGKQADAYQIQKLSRRETKP
jgi:copper chaperone CopZ